MTTPEQRIADARRARQEKADAQRARQEKHEPGPSGVPAETAPPLAEREEGAGASAQVTREPKSRNPVVTDSQREKALSAMKAGYNPLQVHNQEPGYSYFWAATDPTHPQSTEAMEAIGYEVVGPSTAGEEAAPYFAQGDSRKGPVQGSDIVLMRTPTELVELREAERQKMRDGFTRAGVEKFKEDRSRLGAGNDNPRNRRIFSMG